MTANEIGLVIPKTPFSIAFMIGLAYCIFYSPIFLAKLIMGKFRGRQNDS